jgi:hypothetical protein
MNYLKKIGLISAGIISALTIYNTKYHPQQIERLENTLEKERIVEYQKPYFSVFGHDINKKTIEIKLIPYQIGYGDKNIISIYNKIKKELNIDTKGRIINDLESFLFEEYNGKDKFRIDFGEKRTIPIALNYK